MCEEREIRAFELFFEACDYRERGDYEFAVILCQQSLETFPTEAAHSLLGAVYLAQGKLDEAIVEFRKGLELDPSDGVTAHGLGFCLLCKGKVEEAITWLRQAIQAKTYGHRHYSSHLPYHHLGCAYLAKGLLTWARRCFECALAIEPSYEPAREELEQLRRRVV